MTSEAMRLSGIFVALLLVGTSAQCEVSTSDRKDCGFDGIDQGSCAAKGCCWGPVDAEQPGVPWCFFKSSPAPLPPPQDDIATPLPECPHSGVLRLKAGEYTANASLGNCTIIGEAPGVVIHGKVAFDYGLLMGIIHFEGGGATSSCVEGSVEVKGDDVRFRGCDIRGVGDPWFSNVTVSGGRARFEHGGRLCALTVVAGSVDITNVTGCPGGRGHLRVGPGPVHLDMADVGIYQGVYIDGMRGRLGGIVETFEGLEIKNSVVEFDTFETQIAYDSWGLSLDNVTGSGSFHVDGPHDSAAITNCQFNGMVYSQTMGRGGLEVFNTTWRGGSINIGYPASNGYFDIGFSDFQNVSLSGQISGRFDITSSNVTGKIGLLSYILYDDIPCADCVLTITKSRVVFLPASSSSMGDPIRITSSTVSFQESSGALLGSSHLEVNRSSIQVTNVRNGAAIQIRGDTHMYDSNIDVTNCSGPWVSQSYAKANPIIV